MKRFTQLYLDLDGTNATREKRSLLVEYLASAPEDDAAWAIALLTGNRPKGMGASTILKSLCREETACPEWLFEECRTAVGDLSETMALLLPPPTGSCDESLGDTMKRRVLPMIGADSARKEQLIRDAWSVMNEAQRLVFHKLVRGGFRVGVQKQTVIRALAEAHGLETPLIAQRLSGPFSPDPQSYRSLLGPEAEDEHRQRPYPFFLATALERGPESLGPLSDWVVEDKWDGIRAQFIYRDSEMHLWSRGEEPIGRQFPELLADADFPEGTVLDGEVLLFAEGVPAPFAALQKRLNRKPSRDLQPTLFPEDQARFVAYDLLERDGKDIRNEPLEYRQRSLEKVLAESSSSLFLRSLPCCLNSWEDVTDYRDRARRRGTEGLMLKPRSGKYGVGRTRKAGAWLKWKLDPYTADAVMIGAQPGSGRRANLYTDYTFAIWDRSSDPPKLVSFAKAYSGLDQKDIEKLDRWIRKNTVSRNGPFRAVKPEQVFELAFEGIQESTRHRAGLAVRFPRIMRWRTDKSTAEIDDLQTLRELLSVSETRA